MTNPVTHDQKMSAEVNRICAFVTPLVLAEAQGNPEVILNSLFRLMAGQIVVYGVDHSAAHAYLDELLRTYRIDPEDTH